MKDSMMILFGLFGGLAVFIFGMNMMSECLQKAAGDRMKHILAMLTKNPVMGVLAGAVVTAVLQSSSATTVMAIGFVSAGLMTLPQAISIIFGANIGTTMTAQIIAFKISDYIYAIIFIGFIIYFVCKSERIKNIGQTIFAFGLLFLGIETMGDVMKPLAASPVFMDMIARVGNIPVLGVAVGAVMTLVVQSSSATIAVLQNFAAQAGPDGTSSILGLAGAIPILFGDNIGTTITALLASVGQSRDAKRTAVAHCIFNISGTFLFIWFVKPYASFIQFISPKGPEVEVISRQIANAHTVFNITVTLIWVGMIGLMVKIVTRLIPDGRRELTDPLVPVYLDRNVIAQPAVAMQFAAREVIRVCGVVREMLSDIVLSVETEDARTVEEVQGKGRVVSSLYTEISDYLAELFASGGLTEAQAARTSGLMYILSDVERMGSLCVEVADGIGEKIANGYNYSKDAMGDLKKSLELIERMYESAVNALDGGNAEEAKRILSSREKMMALDTNMRKAHMERMNKGKCKAKLTAPFTALLQSLDRMGNNCINLADIAASGLNFQYFLGAEE